MLSFEVRREDCLVSVLLKPLAVIHNLDTNLVLIAKNSLC